MTPGHGKVFAFAAQAGLVIAMLASWAAQAQPAAARPMGELKSLGDERYQIGQIVVDKRARVFTVPGRVHALGKPLEYLAASPGGVKAYESLFELDASGSEFNLACILIGLEIDPDLRSHWPRSGPLPGPRVAISFSWTEGNGRRRISAFDAMAGADAAQSAKPVEWVYVAVPPGPQGVFGADLRGTLVGFKPDQSNVIESSTPVGLGAYGSVRGHPMLPPPGSPIEMTVEAVAAAK